MREVITTGKDLLPKLSQAGVRKQSCDAGNPKLRGASAAPSSSNVGVRNTTNAGGRSRGTSRRSNKKLRSRQSVQQLSRSAVVHKQLLDLNSSEGEVEVPETWKTRLRDSGRIDYARSAESINSRSRSSRGPVHTANVTEACDKDGNPVFSFEPITDYIECHFAGLLNLESLMGDGIAKHIYESWLAEGGELAALYPTHVPTRRL